MEWSKRVWQCETLSARFAHVQEDSFDNTGSKFITPSQSMNSNLKNHTNSIKTNNQHTWEEGQSRPSSHRDPGSHDTRSRKSRNRAKANARIHEEADDEYYDYDYDYDCSGRSYLFDDYELGEVDSCNDDQQHRDTSRKHHDPGYVTANESYSRDGQDGGTRDEPKSQSKHEDPDLSCYTIPAVEPMALPLSALSTHHYIDTKTLRKARYVAMGIARGKAIAADRHVSNVDFEPTPWGTVVPSRKPWHQYGVLPNGKFNNGRIWPESYNCDYTCDYGLCYKTFGTPDACHLGSRCRWKHEIRWADLEFLIRSGRVSLGRARIMLANWQTPVAPKMPARACGRMYSMLFGLGEGLAGSQLLTR